MKPCEICYVVICLCLSKRHIDSVCELICVRSKMRSTGNKRLQILYLLYLRRKHRSAQNKRKYWIHPLLQVRYVEGAFYTLFEKLRSHSDKFFRYFRMSVATFDFILERINMLIQRQDTVMRLCVPPKEMLAVTLR